MGHLILSVSHPHLSSHPPHLGWPSLLTHDLLERVFCRQIGPICWASYLLKQFPWSLAAGRVVSWSPHLPRVRGPRREPQRSSDAACCFRFLCWEAWSSSPPPRSSPAAPSVTEAGATDSHHCGLGLRPTSGPAASTHLMKRTTAHPVNASVMFSNLDHELSHPPPLKSF